MQRLAYHLSKKGQVLKRLRGERWRRDLGEYYILDRHVDAVTRTHVDPVTLAQELGILRSWERVVRSSDPSASAPPVVSQPSAQVQDVPTPALPQKTHRKDAISDATLRAIAVERQRHPELPLRAFGEHLFTSGIYRAVGRDGKAKPAALSFLHRWLGEAKKAGLLS